MKWTKLKVHVNPMAVEAVSDSILGLGIEGIEVEDNFLSEGDKEAMFVHSVDSTIIPFDEVRIVVYLDESMDLQGIQKQIADELVRISEFLPTGSGRFLVEEMPDEDYEHKWKEFYQPFRVGENMIVTPIWEEPEVGKNDIVIKIDPGLAFGSGTHETTSLCVEYLQAIDVRHKKVIDVGCGSGILGIIAVKLGAEQVIGIDIDENAIAIAVENVVSNDVQHKMSIVQGNLLEEVDGPVQVVVANILSDVIMLITNDVKKMLTEDGVFISSGILATRADEVKTHLINCGFDVMEVKTQGEWSAILAKVN